MTDDQLTLKLMIHLSKAAVGEIRRLQCQRHHPDARLRLGVQTGGCSGLYYTIEFEQVVKPYDAVYNCNGIQVVVEPESLNYIAGMTLDYSEDLMGGAFRFDNPNALSTCGCGNSFAVDE